MKIVKYLFLATYLIALDATASEPRWLTWSTVELEEDGGFSVSAEIDRNTQKLKFFTIGTPDGNVSLGQEVLDRIHLPRLNYIEYIQFPLDIEATDFDYRVSIRYGGYDFDAEESCTILDDGDEMDYAPERKVIILVEDGEIKSVQWTTDECDT